MNGPGGQTVFYLKKRLKLRLRRRLKLRLQKSTTPLSPTHASQAV